MKITLFYNQYSQAGSVYKEQWELFPGESGTWFCADTLETKTVDLPNGWTIGKTWGDEPALFDEHGERVFINTISRSVLQFRTYGAIKSKMIKVRGI